MNWILRLIVLMAMVVSCGLQAQNSDAVFIRAYRQIQDAENWEKSGDYGRAIELYRSALSTLRQLEQASPGWNPKVVDYRIRYAREKLDLLEKQIAPAAQEETSPETTGSQKRADSAVVETSREAATLADLRQQVRALEVDNRQLQSKLQEALARVQQPKPSGEESQLAELRSQKDELQAQLKQLQEENKSLQSRLENLLGSTGSGSVSGGPPPARDVPQEERVEQLKKRNEELLQQLARTRDELFKVKAKQDIYQWNQLSNQLAMARARLEVLEARAVPYTEQELALLKTNRNAQVFSSQQDNRSIRELPVGAGPLVRQAQELFRNGRFAQAEEKYKQVLQLANNNPIVLADLAATQMEQGKLDIAEENLQKALKQSPEDAHVLSQLGYLKLRRGQQDEAFDLLSRAAQKDPRNPIIQNYLGTVLVDKGQRQAAETAFRKAIQLAPEFSDAHFNLAYVYATQQPPFLELARFHYKKALDLGHPASGDLDKVLSGN